MFNEVVTLAVFALLKTTTLSTYIHVDPTGLAVLACEMNCTGEVTEAPLAGAQIRTVLTVLLVQETVFPTVMFTPA